MTTFTCILLSLTPFYSKKKFCEKVIGLVVEDLLVKLLFSRSIMNLHACFLCPFDPVWVTSPRQLAQANKYMGKYQTLLLNKRRLQQIIKEMSESLWESATPGESSIPPPIPFLPTYSTQCSSSNRAIRPAEALFSTVTSSSSPPGGRPSTSRSAARCPFSSVSRSALGSNSSSE